MNPWPPWILEFVRNLGTSTLNLQKSQALETPERRESLKLQVGTFEKLRPRRSQVFLPLVTWVRSLKGHPQMEIDLKSLWSIGQLQRCNGFVESQDSMVSVCTCVSQHSTVSVSILLNSFQGSYGKCCTGKALLEAAGNGVSSVYIKKHQCTKVVLQTFGGEIN